MNIINKLECAKKQLDTAIELFLEDKDEISVHTLAGASNGILIDLCEKNSIMSGIELTFKPLLNKEEHKKLINELRKHKNFFKHANKDSKDTIEIPDNRMIIIETVVMYNSLTRRLTPMMVAYYVWLFHSQFDLLKKYHNDIKHLKEILSATNSQYKDKRICLEMARRNSCNMWRFVTTSMTDIR